MDYATLTVLGILASVVLCILWIVMPIVVFMIRGDVERLRQQSTDVSRLLKGTDKNAPGLIAQLVQMNQQLAEIKALLAAQRTPPPGP